MGKPTTHILGISGSPRREGNTDILVKEALRRIADYTSATAEFLRIADHYIKPCQGCRTCMTLGRCIIKEDDFEAVWTKVRSSDPLVLGAPVYWMGPPGVMKNFIDRTHGYYTDHSVLQGKKAILISVATDSGFEPHEAVMASWLTIYGAVILGSARIFACEKGEILHRPQEMDKVRELVDSVKSIL